MPGIRFAQWVLLVFCFAFAPTSGRVHAQASSDEVARNLFHAGKAAYDEGNYQDALQFFEQAYARSQRSALLYNIGQAADRLRLDDKAIESFRAYLAATPDAPNRVEVENRIRALEHSRAASASAAAAVAPTPEQTARAAEPPAPVASAPLTDNADAEGGGVTSKWWFWTAIGAVVVGGVVTAVALSAGGDDANPMFVAGDVGGVHETLVAQ